MTVRFTQVSSPNGRPRCTQMRRASKFFAGLWPIHARDPIAWTLDRPITQPGGLFGIILLPPPEARPSPVLCLADQFGSECVASHITGDGQEVLIRLDRKRLEAALIDRTGSGGVVRRKPSLRMGDGDPAENFRQFPVMPWPEEEMPVIRHEAVGRDPQAGLSMGFRENLLKSGIVSGRFKQGEAAHSAIQDVVGEIAGSKAGTAWQRSTCIEFDMELSRNDSRPR